MIYLHLATKHDVNGNPRRLYVILDSDGDVVDVIDEGYAGNSQVRKKYPDAVVGPRIEVPISEYKDWLKYGRS